MDTGQGLAQAGRVLGGAMVASSKSKTDAEAARRRKLEYETQLRELRAMLERQIQEARAEFQRAVQDLRMRYESAEAPGEPAPAEVPGGGPGLEVGIEPGGMAPTVDMTPPGPMGGLETAY
jgi:hypothetical protein